MSGEPVSFKLDEDVKGRLEDMAEDLGMSPHRAGIRAMDRGLLWFGYGDDGGTYLGRIFGEGGKATAIMGVGFFVAMIAPPEIIPTIATVCLSAAVALLFAERAEPYISDLLGIPEEKRVPPEAREAVADGGDEE